MPAGFILKKIIATLLMPLPISVVMIVAGLIFLLRNKKRMAVGTLVTAVAWISLLSYEPFASSLLHRLEYAYPPLLKAPQDIKYIYVLGGGHNSDSTLPITSQLDDDAIIRLTEAIRLYHQLQEKPTLIVSGYSGYYSVIPHAQMQNRLAIALGVDPDKIISLPEPMDTQAEAKAAKKLFDNKPFILVTSAFHMARAMRWFKQEGVSPIPAPTHHFTNSEEVPYYGIFSVYALQMSTIFIHENIGILWQKIKSIL